MIIAPQPLRGKFLRLFDALEFVHFRELVPNAHTKGVLSERYFANFPGVGFVIHVPKRGIIGGMGEFRIKRVKVENFKSLANFEMRDIPMFACLIGINGCGKTTFFQFIDFVKSLMNGDVQKWLESQGLNGAGELLTLGGERKSNVIKMEIDAVLDGRAAEWKATFNARELRCTLEELKEGDITYKFNAGRLHIAEREKDQTIDYGPSSYTGSIFSFRQTEFSRFVKSICLLGVLDPHAIAQPSRIAKAGKLAHVESNGKNLSAFVAGLPLDKQQVLLEQVRDFYRPLQEFRIKRQQFGWKSLLMREFEKEVFNATNLSYGTLRLFVLLAQQYADDKVVLCDEVENGLNQELFEKFVDKLQNYGEPRKQVFVSTHSGLFLNYLDDGQARESVYFLYKDAKRRTRARRFFDVAEMSEKLNVLGPGEAMGDTDLNQLSERLASEDEAID